MVTMQEDTPNQPIFMRWLFRSLRLVGIIIAVLFTFAAGYGFAKLIDDLPIGIGLTIVSLLAFFTPYLRNLVRRQDIHINFTSEHARRGGAIVLVWTIFGLCSVLLNRSFDWKMSLQPFYTAAPTLMLFMIVGFFGNSDK